MNDAVGKCRLSPGEVKILERRGRDALYKELKADARLEEAAIAALGTNARRRQVAEWKRQQCFVRFRKSSRAEQATLLPEVTRLHDHQDAQNAADTCAEEPSSSTPAVQSPVVKRKRGRPRKAWAATAKWSRQRLISGILQKINAACDDTETWLSKCRFTRFVAKTYVSFCKPDLLVGNVRKLCLVAKTYFPFCKPDLLVGNVRKLGQIQFSVFSPRPFIAAGSSTFIGDQGSGHGCSWGQS